MVSMNQGEEEKGTASQYSFEVYTLSVTSQYWHRLTRLSILDFEGCLISKLFLQNCQVFKITKPSSTGKICSVLFFIVLHVRST